MARSFNANDAHGTLLPSVIPLSQSDGAIPIQRQSIGNHLALRKVDSQAAHNYQAVRNHLHDRSAYWASFVSPE